MHRTDLKVLVVDDTRPMRSLIRRTFSALGIEDVEEAVDGDLGWKTFEKATPAFDLVVTDWAMPLCNGVELAQRIVASGVQTRIWMITAEVGRKKEEEAKASGVDAFLEKPFDKEQIQKLLEDCFPLSSK